MRSDSLFHVFRNTPFGRDTFLQSAYFARQVRVSITAYIPRHNQFLMYFPHRAVTVDLGREYLFDPATAKAHVEALAEETGSETRFLKPTDFTALELPDIPVDFRYMSCPRSISDLSTKVGMGYIGPKVRQIIQHAGFPVLIPTAVFKPWNRIVVFFGGSKNAFRAVSAARALQQRTGLPIHLFTKAASGKPKAYYEELLDAQRLLEPLRAAHMSWLFYTKGRFTKLLYDVPSDALVVVGAYGHGAIKEVLFGSKMEAIQTVLPNNMLIIGPAASTALP